MATGALVVIALSFGASTAFAVGVMFAYANRVTVAALRSRMTTRDGRGRARFVICVVLATEFSF